MFSLARCVSVRTRCKCQTRRRIIAIRAAATHDTAIATITVVLNEPEADLVSTLQSCPAKPSLQSHREEFPCTEQLPLNEHVSRRHTCRSQTAPPNPIAQSQKGGAPLAPTRQLPLLEHCCGPFARDLMTPCFQGSQLCQDGKTGMPYSESVSDQSSGGGSGT